MKKLLLLTSILLCRVVWSQIQFENRATALGIDFSCGNTYIGNGISFFDFDKDGWDDLSFGTETGRFPQFYKNFNGFFLPINLNLPDGQYQNKQINWVDFDNDGDYDLFLTSNTDGNRLFRNNGNLIFEDITLAAGLPTGNLFTFGASWGDYNNDGFLDVFISNRDSTVSTSTPNFLYRNNGDGTFTDVSEAAGIDRLKHLSFCSAFFDFNNDGWQDIYVSNDKVIHKNLLYKNNGDGTFTEIGAQSGTDVSIDAMTVTIGDYNNDGWFDIYVTNLGESVFFKNNGDETFTDVALETGTQFNSNGWGAIFLDGENDGDLDLYVSGELFNHPQLKSAAFFENTGNNGFSIPENAGFENDQANSYSNAVGDLNNDGLADFIVTNSNNQNVYVWENQNTSNKNWIKIDLEGVSSNRDGIGSVIELSANGQKQYLYTLNGEGYISQNSKTKIIGLGNANIIDYIKIKWLSGIEDILFNVNVNQKISILEGSSLSTSEFMKQDFKIGPNPVTNELNIESLNQTVLKKIGIVNLLGQPVRTWEGSDFSIALNLETLNSGIYILTISTDVGTTTRKILKR